jgi:hypothetical protein
VTKIFSTIANMFVKMFISIFAVCVLVFCVMALTRDMSTPSAERAVAAAPRSNSFTFEKTELASGYVQGQVAVAYVLRNNTSRTFELVAVNCAVYAGDKLIDVTIGIISDLEPRAIANGKTEPTAILPTTVEPDRVACTAQSAGTDR